SSDNTAEGTVSPSSVTFTTANWNIAQTVTVTGVDDAIDDGDVVYTIETAAATSSDTNYNGLDPADLTVTNEDNDGVGISVSAISGNTGEDGSTASFTIVLDSEPTADVTIGLSSDNTSEGTVSPGSLTFTTANWNVPQMVTVTGIDDNDVDGDVTYTIIISAAASSDANYNGLDPTNVVLINEDDDSINGTPVITGQVSINSIDEDTDFTIALTNLTVTDPDNNYPADHTLILLTGNDYDISGSSIIPQADYNGALRVNIKVSDGVNESNVYEYEVDIQPVNDKPILVADALTVQFGNTLEGNLLTNDSDVENDDLVLTDISPLPDGLIFNTDGSFMYSGDTEIGTIEMDYVVCDDGDPSECAQSTFTLTIEGGDFDGDGISDSYEIQFDDVDDDGEPEYRDLDSDNDGISDSQEAGADPENPVDTDQDGTPDFLDMDSDGDGKLDSEEGVEDCDRDGILNYIDNDDQCKMKIADAFSPNGDGKNDEWIIQGIESYPGNKVTIFNRWGNKIFEIDGYDNNSRVWRGEINTNIGSDKNASYSTYYFIIDLKDGSKPIAGNILISR
ncbi:gliding motility-associated C-terminal domain-containing protein, partial [Ekhidna sp.]|uniref:T9SS type B sorting domain-containing protein n=1 Tax=Ekhidna sp. TaxID=2608089 RepID=UPI003297A7B4